MEELRQAASAGVANPDLTGRKAKCGGKGVKPGAAHAVYELCKLARHRYPHGEVAVATTCI